MAAENAQLTERLRTPRLRARPWTPLRTWLPLALLLAAGCVPMDFGTPPSRRTEAPPARPVAPPPPTVVLKPVPEAPVIAPGTAEPQPPMRPAPTISAASQALLNQSRSAQAAGNYDLAAASIERALRIDPRQPLLWLELGNVRLKEGDYAQAEAVGRKALSLSAGDATLAARAEDLIAAAKRH